MSDRPDNLPGRKGPGITAEKVHAIQRDLARRKIARRRVLRMSDKVLAAKHDVSEQVIRTAHYGGYAWATRAPSDSTTPRKKK
jgi:hypothetical protein